MSTWTIIRRSVRFYWRTHLGVVLGAALATMVLTGSLLVGDSVKATLRRQAELRIGKVDAAVLGGDRFFRAELASRVDSGTAPVLVARGSIARADGSSRVNQAQVLGVDTRFWSFAPEPPDTPMPPDGIALNERLATQLGVRMGDTLIVRIEKPSAFSRDAPLSGEENEVIAIRANVGRLVTDAEFGRFSLQASQVPPFTVFLPLELLQTRLQLAGRTNLLLAGSNRVEGSVSRSVVIPFTSTKLPLGSTDRSWNRNVFEELQRKVAEDWTLEDAALELKELKAGGVELRTSRVFLDPPVVSAAPRGVDALTYLVNELRAGEKRAAYSMVTALDAPSSGFLPAELADHEIAINEWLAEDLGVREGGKVTLKYFVMGERRQLVEKEREFTVLAVIPMTEPQLNASWMPDFPGLKDAKNCRDWDPGFDIDESKIRDKDEEYWDTYAGTPKAFVNITVGQQMWENRWGNLTAIRYPAGTSAETVASAIRAKLTPEQIGMNFIPLREHALAATRAPVDFGQLFASFSFFIIVAAAVLTALLFTFSLEQRSDQAGLLLALGLPAAQVRRLFLWEGVALAVIGAVAGTAGAAIYTQLVLRALATVWRGAVGSVEFVFAAPPMTLIAGAGGSVLVALVAMWLASRRQLRQGVGSLLRGGANIDAAPRDGGSTWLRWTLNGAPVLCLVAAVALALGGGGAGAFFGAGALLLTGGLVLALSRLRSAARGESGLERLGELGWRNAARRRGRSMATIAVLASGVFIVVAVDSFRQRTTGPTNDRSSGTGGFALIGESALPIYDDLNTTQGREVFGLDEKLMAAVSVVPMRVREGDDASCLNLNRALEPRLLGANVQELASRKAFRFGAQARGLAEENAEGWHVLDSPVRGAAIPGVVDQATLQWALQKKLGDVLEYRSGSGEVFQVALVAAVKGSVLQGQVVISEKHFVEKLPGHSGYRSFLIDAPLDRADAVAEHLSRALQDRGLEVTPAWRRLAEFQAVENTYLSIFQVLGGLGLLLGSIGLAIVVARNVLERRREFGLLEAVGFRAAQLRQLVLAEHRWLIVCGLLIGVGSALLAVWPGLRDRAEGLPMREMGLLLVALAVGSIFWAWLATRLALRGSRIEALRSE